MEVSPELRRMIHRGAAPHEMRDTWRRQGGLILREEAVLIAKDGRSSLEEVLRVTHDEGTDQEELAPTTAPPDGESSDQSRGAA